MFQFPGFPPAARCIHAVVTELFSAGFPHSDICGSMSACDSPQLFAAGRVLLRRLVPWHPPCALLRLITLLRPTFRCRFSLPTLTGLRLSFLPSAVVKMRRRSRAFSGLPCGILKTIRDQFYDLSLQRGSCPSSAVSPACPAGPLGPFDLG